jgi:phosphoglucosamine mutase
MPGLSFGTDGVRAVANTELTPSFALDLGRAAARVLGFSHIVVGRDTRRSGSMLEAAFAAGCASEGATVELMGVVPTPAVAYVAACRGCAGAMISASHNPFADNGIKVFGIGGRKLPDDVERAIERELATLGPSSRSGADVGIVRQAEDAAELYTSFVSRVVGSQRLTGMRIVLDAANGSASPYAEALFSAQGAEVVLINSSPNGVNINDACGATHPAPLAAAVVANGAALGLAFDGDADRLIAVDHTGAIVDGDHVIALLALDLRTQGKLKHDTVVVTVMTNLGFRIAMDAAGITVVDTAVGDRYVLEALDAGGFSLGGEQSGHVIFRDVASTGDGMLTGLLLADAVRRSGRSLAELSAAAMTRLPQVLVNVRMAERDPNVVARLQPDIEAAERELGDGGRVLVRTSGTEPIVRVMVEAPLLEQARRLADRIASRLR